MSDQLLIVDRPPRIQPELPAASIEIPAPPPRNRQGMRALLQLALPLVTIIGFSAVSMGGRGGPLTAIIMAFSVLGASAVSLFSFLQDRKEQAEREKEYAARLVEMNREMARAHDQQR